MIDTPLSHFRIDQSLPDRLTVWIDVAGRSVNVLFGDVFDELESIISLAERSTCRPIVFRSAKKKGFIVGADLKRIAMIQSDEEIQKFMLRGQAAFNRLESSGLHTIALIQGSCLGGGLEFALACKVRIACDDPETKLGMPESKIGLMPGWGGTQRLVECIGIKKGLNMLLNGEAITARQSIEIGLIDALLESPHVESQLSSFLEQEKDRVKPIFAQGRSHVPEEPSMDWEQMRQEYNLESHSARAILLAVEKGRTQSRDAGFQVERQQFYRLLQSDEAQACMRRFVK